MILCNCGSVGTPNDGDPRASYLLIDDNLPKIRRMEYDIDTEMRRLLISEYPHKRWLASMRQQGTYVPPFK